MPTHLELGIVGLGFAGQVHSDAASSVELADINVDISGIVDPLVSARDKAQAQGFPAYGDVTDMLKSHAPDLLIVAVPPAAVLGVIQKILAAPYRPQALLLEKPLAGSLGDAEKIAYLLGQYPEIFTSVGFTGLYHPEFATAAQMISGGKIGEVEHIKEKIHLGSAEGFPVHYMNSEFGGVVLLNGGHTIQHICSYTQTQPSDWRVLKAKNSHHYFQAPSPDSSKAELILTTSADRGRPVKASCSWQWRNKDINNYLSAVQGGNGNIKVYGFKGVQHISTAGKNDSFIQVHPDQATFAERHLSGFIKQMEIVLSAIINKESPPVPISYALGVQELLEQIANPAIYENI